MKTSILGVLCGALAALVLGPTASASVIIYEPFDYTAGQTVTGQAEFVNAV